MAIVDRDLIEERMRSDFHRSFVLALVYGASFFATDVAYGQERATVAFRLPDPFFVPEGIAYDPRSGSFFVGSTFRGVIARVARDGRVSMLTRPNEQDLFGIVGIRVDTVHRLLWAATSQAGAGMPLAGARREDEGRSSLVAIELGTGRVVRRFATPPGETHFYNDVAVGADGEVYFTDTHSKELLIWAPGESKPRRFLENVLPASPNGLDIVRGGRQLVVALETRIGVVDLASRSLRVLDPHPLVRTAYIDGLYAVPGGVLTVEPWDGAAGVVKRYYLDGALTRIDSVRVALAAHAEVEQPTTAAVVGDTAYVIANSHLQTFRRTFTAGDTTLARDSVRGPVILRVPIGGALRPPRIREMGVIPLASRAEVAIVDGINLNVLARVATFAHPQDVVAAPDGRTVYVLEAGTSRAPGRTIAILDARERRIVRRITLERCTMPHWGQPSVDGRTLFVTCAPERAVVELDVGDWRERRRWVTPDPVPWMFVVPKEGDRIYMANFDAGTLSIVRDPSAAPKTVRLGGRPVGIAERPDGSEVWVSSTESDSLHIFDARRDSLVASMPSGGGGPVRIAFTSDGAKALITQSRTGVVDIFDTRTRARIARIEVPGFPKGILIRPDDRVAYVSAVDSSTITAIDIARGRSLGSVKIEGAPERMAWLPSAAWPTP